MHTVMYKCTWCKQKPQAIQHGKKIEGYKMFVSGPVGTGKSHAICLIQRDMMCFFRKSVKPDDDQLLGLLIAPTASAAFHIGCTTLHSVFSLHSESYENKAWKEKQKQYSSL